MLRPRVDSRVPSDQILLEQTRAGNQEAFGELMDRHYGHCFHVATSILHDRGDAQDAVQDAMWRALTHLDQYREEAPFSAWLTRIVVNHCLMCLRTRKRVHFVSCTVDSEQDGRPPFQLTAASLDPERQLINDERHDVVEKEIQLLPAMFKTVILLHDVHELPLADIAERLHITVGAIKGRLLRARSELKKRVTCRYGGKAHLQAYFRTRAANLRKGKDSPAIELSTNRHMAESPNDEERRYPDENPFNSVCLILREQLAAGAGREVQL